MSKIGEIIHASTGQFTAQCYLLHNPPPLGSLVKTLEGETEILALVSGAQTRGIDPSRVPVARGEYEDGEEALFKANPQLARLLVTEFSAVVTGYFEHGNLHCYLPPRPAHIHAFVHPCSDEEIRLFSVRLEYLDTLAISPTGLIPADEVISASLRTFSRLQIEPDDYLVKAGKHLALLLGDQLTRLNSILKRLK
jgi:hypothetical protein